LGGNLGGNFIAAGPKAHPMSNLLEQAIRADDGSRTPKIIQGCARHRRFSFMKLRNPRNKQC
jgi:hypothetical protein